MPRGPGGCRGSADQPASLTPDAVGRIVDAGLRRYFRSRHQRVESFVADCYSLPGTLALHRQALGLDLLRAPVNIVLMPFAAAVKAAGFIAGRLGSPRLAARLAATPVLVRTGVDRELAWRVYSGLLELPWRDGERICTRNALEDEILSDPELSGLRAVVEADGRIRSQLGPAMAAYGTGRAATSELSLALASLGAGALGMHSFTPTVLSLGPALAGVVAARLAIADFPLGPAFGSVWYGIWPVTPSPALSAAVTGCLVVVASVAAAFSGIVTDPVLRRLGLHRRRLHRMLRAMEDGCTGHAGPGYPVREQYVVRLLDLVEVARLLHRGLA